MKTELVLLSLFALIGASSAYYCWVCDSDDYFSGATCSDPFYKADSALAKRQCSGDCFKEVITYADGNQRYRRGCDACVKGCSTTGSTETCRHCCYGQLCNGAESYVINRVMTILVPVVTTLFVLL